MATEEVRNTIIEHLKRSVIECDEELAREASQRVLASVVGCWNGRIDLSRFLATYSSEQLQRVFAHHPRTRLETMLELAEKATKVVE